MNPAIGIEQSTTFWNSDFDNPANKNFMAAWEKKYGADRLPTYYAAPGLRHRAGDRRRAQGGQRRPEGHREVPQAMLKADFRSVRGKFKFGPNQHPIQDWYSTEVEKDAGGKLVIKTTGKILTDHGDAYAKDCKL